MVISVSVAIPLGPDYMERLARLNELNFDAEIPAIHINLARYYMEYWAKAAFSACSPGPARLI